MFDNSNEVYNLDYENLAMQDKNFFVPPEILGKFNWGAWGLNWLWGIGNRVWIALIALGIVLMIPYLGWVFALLYGIWLGKKGNELAWKAKQWRSIEHFQSVQRIWAVLAVIWVLGHLFCTVYLYHLIIGSLGGASSM